MTLDHHVGRVADQIDRLLEISNLKDLVFAYFEGDTDRSLPVTFAGSLFDTFGENHPHRIGNDDLLALNLLDVRVNTIAVRQLLENDDLNRILRQIDVTTTLCDMKVDPKLETDAKEFWSLLNNVPGFGPTRVSKLCARKRPHLIPIRDSIILRVMGLPSRDTWSIMSEVLSDPGRVQKIEALDPEVPGYVPSMLRLLDIAAWMIGSNSKSARNSRMSVGLKSEPWM